MTLKDQITFTKFSNLTESEKMGDKFFSEPLKQPHWIRKVDQKARALS